MSEPGGHHREILRLAVPAFLALIAEPLFLLADSAIVGHLGTAELAGLGVASAALLTAAGVFVFLAYGTTSVVARQLGAGDLRAAITAGVDGLWLAGGLGVVTAAVVAALAEPIVALFGASEAVIVQATTYLRISSLGIPAMLAILAVTGVLRGLQDTRTPLIASVVGFSANIALNVLLVYGFGWGIAGSAWGTVLAQTGMAVGLVAVLLRSARAREASLHPHPGRILAAARTGVPLLIRTLALRAALLVTTWAAASLGDVPLAAHQVALTVWSFLAFALDALAIAAQAIVGRSLGAGDQLRVRVAMRTMTRWGVWGGAGIGLVLVALHRVLPPLFTGDEPVRTALAAALVVVGLGQAVAGYVFVLDGVLIGAGDGRWLAWGQLVSLLGYLPLVLALRARGPSDSPALDIVLLWLGFTAWMGLRAAVLGWRARQDAWMVTGA
ncbi:MATE family efflux transporter [Intrasporangium calvum]|uniref:MATE efflux family protein n=1 Tax=Intrasporangium calvum (strain ATCC 23552 / DSM 43043 / JCM 3097 / NBRC 12989 / NCIMB 10167 / NRRL B-3866 / 7 KIP) TaxID=710696 RepID=E6S7B8_INTC7|nr:MATE family efflux transporter [Intrasporangium calvum]ADU50081.1 MATE efflux family protein [Intrasporangium calvum DSM 43043]